jgi:hypothetical protein
MHPGNRERSLLLAVLVSIELTPLTPLAAAHLRALNLIALNLI